MLLQPKKKAVLDMLKKYMCLTAALAVLTGFYGCSSKDDAPLSEPEPVTSEVSQTEVTQEKTEAPTEPVRMTGINPLTGEAGYNEEAEGKRPVAIMVNNLAAALPQYGIEQADIIYELPVEGGITRLMAVYADYTSVPDVCSVRSCRYYYPLICLGMDAIYCHWGSDQTIALDTLNRTGIDHIDGGYEKTMFYRDPERVGVYSSEHTGYIKGSELPDKIAEKGFRTDLGTAYKGAVFSFAPEDDKTVPSGRAASKVVVNFSSAYYSTFELNSEGQYEKLHSGSPHIDQKTGNTLAFDNIFVLQTDIHKRDDGYLMDVALKGGNGYYISNGGAEKITWTKTSEKSPIKVYSSSGDELQVNIGESYIGIIGKDKKITIE